jgi:hypothetical protein
MYLGKSVFEKYTIVKVKENVNERNNLSVKNDSLVLRIYH